MNPDVEKVTASVKAALPAQQKLAEAAERAKRSMKQLAQAAHLGEGFARGPRPTPRPVSARKRRRREVAASRRANR